MKVHADRDVCIGSGLCALRVPAVFDQDDEDGTVVLLAEEPDPESRSEILEAVLACPSGALRVDG